jgi:acyl-coenzyme A synthetase/AMP-(fatty) acid ligase
MLYDRWQQILSAQAGSLAVKDSATGAEWTFAGIQAAVDALPELPSGEVHVVSMREGAWPFVIETLRAWRDRAVLFPVENGPLPLPDQESLPPGICHLKSTSGSTGRPRYVMFREEQLAADVESIRAGMGMDREFPNLAVVSLAHSYGFSNLVLPLLLQGHPMVLVPDPMPSSKRQAHALGGLYTLPAVPAMWRAWHQAGLLKGAPIALAISAGAPLPVELEQEVFADSGIKIHNFYGSSECGGIAYDAGSLPRTDACYAGTPLPGVTVRTDPDGCLVVQSAAVGEGYWPAPEPALGGGAFATSDLIEICSGALFMRGRVGDTINIAGRKLNPAEVEAALLTCEGVRHCVVFGVPSVDAARCDEAVACVNAASGVRSEDLARWLGNRLPAWQRPRRYWICHELTPNARGKLSRAEWRARFLAEDRTTGAGGG